MTRLTSVFVTLVALAGCTGTLVDHRADPSLTRAVLECAAGEQSCGGGCYASDALICDRSTCTVCPAAPAGAHALCGEGGDCDFACDGGLVRCGNTCLPAGTFTCGDGAGCQTCQVPAGGVGLCTADGACSFECPGATRLCANACVAESIESCGACGNVCPAPTGTGGGIAVCSTVAGSPGQGTCGASCAAGSNLCGGGCVAEDDTSCGSSCSDCTTALPLNAFGSCDPGTHTCEVTCNQGYLRCATGCCQATAVSAGFAHACAVTTEGGLVCWGANESGQLGIGTKVGSPVPVTVYASGSGVAKVAAGYSHTCAVFQNGQVACWGDNTTGELGVDTSGQPVLTPTLIPLAKSARWVAGGGGGPSVFAHTCVVNVDDTVTCWGLNDEGQLGTGASSTTPLGPVQVPGLAVRAGDNVLAVGASHTCAVTAAGALVCWGANDRLQAGDVTPGVALHLSPFQVPGVSNATFVMAGNDHTCAIETSSGGGGGGSSVAVCWGDNRAGEVVPGSSSATAGPTLVDSGTFGSLAPTRGAAGPDFTCLVGKDETPKCFGNNSQWQLSTDTGCATPAAQNAICAPTMGSEVFVGISGGWAFTCALFASGGVACFGTNASGQLGDGKAPLGHAQPAFVFGG